MMTDTLSTADLSIGYSALTATRHTVAESLELHVAPGEFVCLLGPNGAGKSTLLRTLAGLQARLGGAVSVDGRDLDGIPAGERAQIISVVVTERAAAPSLRVYELVASGRHPHTGWFGELTDADERIVAESLHLVDAASFAERLVGDLSDGERQRVMIARALAQTPKLLLLDEITAFLDLPSRVRVLSLLRRLARERLCGVVLSSHDLDLSLRLADRIWLMPGGGALRVGAPEDLALGDAFANVFDTDEIRFDRESATFALEPPDGARVAVHGEGSSAEWTKRALVRGGYVPVTGDDAAEAQLDIEAAAPAAWRLCIGPTNTNHATLESVLAHLNSVFSPAIEPGSA